MSDKIIDKYFKKICYLIRDNLKQAVEILDNLDEDSEYVEMYIKHHDGVSHDEASKLIGERVNKLGELSDSIAEEYELFLKNINLPEDDLVDLHGIDTMKEIWFGDYFGSEKYEALDQLVEHLESQKKQLSKKSFTKSLKQ